MQNRNIDYNHINLNSHDNNINSVPRQASLKHYIQFNGKSTSRPIIDHKSYHADPHPLQFNHPIKSTQKNYQYDQAKESWNQKINFMSKPSLNKFGQNYSQNQITYKHYKPLDPSQFFRRQSSFFLEHEQNPFTSVKDKIMKNGISSNPGMIKNEFETLNIPKQSHSQQLIQQSQPINYYRNSPHLNSIYIPSNKLSSKQQQQNNNVKPTSPQFFHQSQTISLLRKDIISLKQKLSIQQKQYQSYKQEAELKNIEKQSLMKEMLSKLEVTIDLNKHLKSKFNDLTILFNLSEDALRQQKKLRQKLMNEKEIWQKKQDQMKNKIQGLENYILIEEQKFKGLTQKLTSLEGQLLIYKEKCQSQESSIEQMKQKIERQSNKNEYYETDLRQGKQILKASALIIEQLTFQLKRMQNQKKQLSVEMERILDEQKSQKLQSQVQTLNDRIKMMESCLEKEIKKNQQKIIMQLQQKEFISNLAQNCALNQIQESKNLQKTLQTVQIETQTCQMQNLSEKQKEMVSQNILLQSNVQEYKKIIKNLELKLKTMSPQKLNRTKQMLDEIGSLKLCNSELSKQNKRINLILQGLNIKIIQMDRVYYHLNQQISTLHIQKMNQKFKDQTISNEM